MLYRTPLRMLGDLVSPKALERIFESGARAKGKPLSDLDHADIADILKRDVFKRLQLSVPAPLAKKRVQDVLDTIEQDALKNTVIRNEDAVLAGLEGASKRFALYFDWPEAQKLRALIGVARSEMDAGKSVPGLLDEGMGLVATLERRLSEGLVTQAGDLADLKADMQRFTGVGGPKLRRLEALIAQIETAQSQDTLSLAEVERARHLALDLRKLVESSVISADPQLLQQELPSAALLPPEAQQRLSELDRESQARDLADLAQGHAALLRARPELAERLGELRERLAAGEVLGPQLAGLRETFNHERVAQLAAERARLSDLAARLEALPSSTPAGAREEARLALELARGTLSGEALVTEELGRLEGILRILEGQTGARVGAEHTEQLLAARRDLYQLESALRGVRGAEGEFAARLEAARAQLERGELPPLEELWAALERRMGQQAQERESFDGRADALIEEYDRYRHLAGETIQRLGRLADNLRRVRRLGSLSAEASARYGETLQEAEALLGEARAEFEAARELTSAFGADALEGLLGVFDSGGAFGDTPGGVFGGTFDLSFEAPTNARLSPDPLALALEGLAAHGGAQLALLRGGALSWGSLDPASAAVVQDMASLAARLGRPRLVSVELAEGGLLALPVGDAVLVARVEDDAALPSWREQLLGARAALA